MTPHIPGRIVGNTLTKRVIRAKHFLRWVNGFAWSEAQLHQAKEQDVEVLELEEDSGRILRVSLSSVLERGKRFQHGGYEPQVGIAESLMSVVDKNQPSLFGGFQ